MDGGPLNVTRGTALGVVQLANAPVRHRGFLGSPATFDFAVEYATVDDAWADRVMDGDPALAVGYAAAARSLEDLGAAAIVTNCGFAVCYQDAMASAARIPVASSALLLAPLVLAIIGRERRLGVLTADGRRLTVDHLRAAGIPEDDLTRVVVLGTEDSASSRSALDPSPAIDVVAFQWDIVAAARRFHAQAPDLGAFLFECTGFGVATDAVRAATGLPVFDVLVLSRLLMDACGAGRAGTTARVKPVDAG